VQPNDIIGKHISTIIPLSRASEVLANGKAEMGDLCDLPNIVSGKKVIVNRIPVRGKTGKVVGMISQAIFSDIYALKKLSQKIENLERDITDYQQRIKATLTSQYNLKSIKGESVQITKVRKQIGNYAELDAPVLVQGPTGTGKELIAHALHSESLRSQGPLVFINCASIPENLFESELFGYVRGAFSGAHQAGKMGQVELANGGTLFLDEIGDMPLSAQAKMLRVLETKTICRVGDVTVRPVDFRLISATNQDIKSMIKAGSFRADLYYRINTFIIEVPGLSHRTADIIPLAQHFLARIGCKNVRLSGAAVKTLCSYHWPGNIRELHNAVVHASSICSGELIEPQDLPKDIRGAELVTEENGKDPRRLTTGEDGSLPETVAAVEISLIKKALREKNDNITKAAAMLNISRSSLYDRLKKLGIKR
jgi:transcriptional regulator with PAS, ATPase and Fis domain